MEMTSLSSEFFLIPDISESDFDFIQKIIASTDLSYYEIQKPQFIAIKNKERKSLLFEEYFQFEKMRKN